MNFSGSLFNTCSFCNASIKCGELKSFDGKLFCDIVCAKLYNDNVEHIKINIREYNKLYNSNQLSSQAMSLLEKIKIYSFEMLPYYKIDDLNDIDESKKHYKKIMSMLK